MRPGQHWDAVVATLVILCANILLREAAQRINLQPHQQATDLELCYRIQVTCGEQDEILVRTLILQALNGVALRLQSCAAPIFPARGNWKCVRKLPLRRLRKRN